MPDGVFHSEKNAKNCCLHYHISSPNMAARRKNKAIFFYDRQVFLYQKQIFYSFLTSLAQNLLRESSKKKEKGYMYLTILAFAINWEFRKNYRHICPYLKKI